MRWGFPTTKKAISPATILVYAFSGGLLGYFFQIHKVFLEGSSHNIPVRTAKGFIAAGILSFFLCFIFKIIASSAIHRVLKKGIVAFSHLTLYAALAYLSYILLKNTESLFRFDSLLQDILLVYPVFVAMSLVATLILRFTIRGSFASSSIVTFLLFASYILIKTGSVIGFTITLFYYVYLILLGRFSAGGIARLLRIKFDSALDALLISFVCGILSNYVVWYIIGQMTLLYSATVYGVVLLVSVAGFIRYGKSFSLINRYFR